MKTSECPLSASEYVSTLQAAPPWQHWESQTSTNAEEGRDGRAEGQQVDPLLLMETMDEASDGATVHVADSPVPLLSPVLV